MPFDKTSIVFSFRPGIRTGSLATISADSVNRGGKFCTLTLRLAQEGEVFWYIVLGQHLKSFCFCILYM